MAQKRERDSRPTDENDSPEPEVRGDKRESAEKASATADEFLAEVDQALQDALGVGGENLDPDELNDLADQYMKSYIQKGGQ